jgi:WD40 repeat protein
VRHGSPVMTVQFDSDSRRILSREFAGPAHVWQVGQDEKLAEVLRIPETDVVVFSPDGTRIAATDGATVQILDVTGGKTISQMTMARERIVHLTFSPDGTRLATAGGKSSARIWDVTTGAAATPPLNHKDRVMYVVFSPDGTQLLTASADNSARLWDAATGDPLSPPLSHADAVRHAAFSSSGRRIVTSSEDKTSRVWDIAQSVSVDDLAEFSHLLSARRVDETGALVVMDQVELLAAWQQVRNTLRGLDVAPQAAGH